MATWGGHGLRGSTLEDMINRTNEAYRDRRLALIQKIPTPITPVDMNKQRLPRHTPTRTVSPVRVSAASANR